MNLKNNTILITGGGSGIGRGLAERLHASGNKVIIAGRRKAALDEVVALNPGMAAVTLDQSDPQAIVECARQTIRDYPALNIIINNAGVQRVENLHLGQAERAEEQVTSNFLGPVRLIAAFMPHLLAQPSATIINVTSALGFVPQAMIPTYSATKAALHAYTLSLRYQLQNTPVRVLEIIPPWVQTALQGERGFDERAMPLEDYLDQTMALLAQPPESGEIVVDAAKRLRFAEQAQKFTAVFTALNDGRAEEFGNPPRRPD